MQVVYFPPSIAVVSASRSCTTYGYINAAKNRGINIPLKADLDYTVLGKNCVV
jgi:hypothetical protein